MEQLKYRLHLPNVNCFYRVFMAMCTQLYSQIYFLIEQNYKPWLEMSADLENSFCRVLKCQKNCAQIRSSKSIGLIEFSAARM